MPTPSAQTWRCTFWQDVMRRAEHQRQCSVSKLTLWLCFGEIVRFTIKGRQLCIKGPNGFIFRRSCPVFQAGASPESTVYCIAHADDWLSRLKGR